MCGVQGGGREITVTLTHSEAASLEALMNTVRSFSHKLRVADAAEMLNSCGGYVNQRGAAEGLRTGAKRQRFVAQEIGA